MLRKIRRILAAIVAILLTMLFLDFTGMLHPWFGWLAKIQLVPAILAVNVIVIVSLAALTLIFGRVYCSVICPLGIMQDIFSYFAGKRKGKKNRFRYSPAKSWLRYGVLIVFIAGIALSISAIVSLLDPYAAYGRIASNLFAPVYRLGNNFLAFLAERADSYAFYATDVWIKSWITFGVAIATFALIAMLAWRNGRTYCNTICPAGTALGLLSKFSVFKLAFDTDKCTDCGLCSRNCKASCINSEEHKIDNSRCVACFNCIDKCKFNAIKYTPRLQTGKTSVKTSMPAQTLNDKHEGLSRRGLLSLLGGLAVANTIKAQQLSVDGGLADIADKKRPVRKTPIAPPGASGIKNLKDHCSACQLCVSSCPNNILLPSSKLETFMQPEISYEKGYCRPECVECSLVCPTSAIKPITVADKSVTSIGNAVWIKDNCVVLTDNVQCTICENHCPATAIILVKLAPEKDDSLKIPAIDTELCIGCGACEYLCPARPFSAIYVEGNVRHREI